MEDCNVTLLEEKEREDNHSIILTDGDTPVESPSIEKEAGLKQHFTILFTDLKVCSVSDFFYVLYVFNLMQR